MSRLAVQLAGRPAGDAHVQATSAVTAMGTHQYLLALEC